MTHTCTMAENRARVRRNVPARPDDRPLVGGCGEKPTDGRGVFMGVVVGPTDGRGTIGIAAGPTDGRGPDGVAMLPRPKRRPSITW